MGYHIRVSFDGMYISTKIQHLLAIVIVSIIQKLCVCVCDVIKMAERHEKGGKDCK